ncbi:hypothetical protein ACFLWX_01395 [Chloroflexota bacterium]
MERAGLRETFIRQFIEQKICNKVTGLLESAENKGIMPFEYAKTQAEERFLKIKESIERVGNTSKAWRFALTLYRRRLVPKYLTSLVGTRYFDRMIE